MIDTKKLLEELEPVDMTGWTYDQIVEYNECLKRMSLLLDELEIAIMQTKDVETQQF